MTCDVRALVVVLIVFVGTCSARGDNIMELKIEVFYPKGFTASLKDDGYSHFGFRGNINENFNDNPEGHIVQNVVKPEDGYWVYRNKNLKLEIGDIITYWVYIEINGVGYKSPEFEYNVTEYANRDSLPGGAGGTTPKSPALTLQSTTEPELSLNKIFGISDQPCPISKTSVQGQNSVCKDALIFHEDFDKTSLRYLRQWNAEIMFPREPDYPFNFYMPDNTVSFEEGSLVIRPVLTEAQEGKEFLHDALDLSVRCTGRVDRGECKHEASGADVMPPVITAKMSTRRTFNFKYGRIEVRAKLPAGSWLSPEINLEPSDLTYGQDHYGSGIMRVAFARGNPSLAKKLYGGPVLSDAEPFRSSLLKEKIGIENWDKDFHNYTMVWRPDGIDLLVDGEQYGTVNPGGGFFEAARKQGVTYSSQWVQGTVMAPLDEMFHVTLGLRVGGIHDFADDLTDKPWRNRASKARLQFWKQKDSWHPSWYNSQLSVDFVRVYAL